MRVNVSAIKLFQRSQLAWYYRYVLRRVPRKPPGAYFYTGTWWHLVVEHLAASKSITKTADHARALQSIQLEEFAQHGTDPDWQLVASDFADETSRLIRLFPLMPQRFIPSDIITVEQSIESTLPGSPHTLIGRPDQIIKMHDKYWHLQFKTASDRTPMKVFIPSFQRDLHELAYAWLIWGKYCTPSQYGGTLLNVIRKISNKAIDERPESAFVQELIPISDIQVTDAISDITQIANDMSAILSSERCIIQNRESDTNRYGNVLSPYWDVYTKRISITDDYAYMDAPADRYELEDSPSGN